MQITLSVLSAVLLSLAQAAVAGTSVEIVQSVPVETNLAVPGIRDTQQVWIEMLDAARRTIDIEQFYVESRPGEALEPVLEAVKSAASRGVRVRLLVDSNFFSKYPGEPRRLAGFRNIEVKVIDFSSIGGVQHSKFFIVDGSVVFIGSANFDWLAMSHIHEVGVRLEDIKIARQLGAIFDRDWRAGRAVPAAGTSNQSLLSDESTAPFALLEGVSLVASPRSLTPAGVGDTLDSLRRMISKARKRVRIQVYQYSTRLYGSPERWNVLDAAIRKAAGRGVQVQLMVDSVALRAGANELKALAAVRGVEVRKVAIPEWSGGHLDYARLVHSKYVTVDGTRGWVGTENWAGNYFTASRNVGVTLDLPSAVSQLDRIFERLWESPYATAL